MWIIIEDGEIFEGDISQLDDVFGVTLTSEDDVRDFCESEGWKVKIYSRQGESWN